MNSEIIKWGVAIGIVAYGLLLVYKSGKQFRTCLIAYQKYSQGSKKLDKVEVNAFTHWLIIYTLVGIGVLCGFVYELMNGQDIITMSAFIFAFMFVITFLLELYSRRKIIFDEDGFYFANDYHRYRSINGIERRKGVLKNYEVRVTTSSEAIILPKKFGNVLNERATSYRLKRKSRR